jgi:hypothetical protein
MASLAFDLGRWDCSRQLAASASTYADLAGHDSLVAWTRGLEATLAFWSGDGDLALERVDAGLAVAPAGESRFRLLHIAARAHAVRGDRDGVAAAIKTAEDDRALAEQRGDDLHHGVGGEFVFDAARANACAGAAWLRVGDGAEATRCARLSLELAACADVPPSAGMICGVGIDLASALLMDGQLDGAAAMLQPVLSHGPEFGSMSLGGRLATARSLLVARPRDPAAVRLADEIDGWLAGTGIPVQQRK